MRTIVSDVDELGVVVSVLAHDFCTHLVDARDHVTFPRRVLEALSAVFRQTEPRPTRESGIYLVGPP